MLGRGVRKGGEGPYHAPCPSSHFGAPLPSTCAVVRPPLPSPRAATSTWGSAAWWAALGWSSPKATASCTCLPGRHPARVVGWRAAAAAGGAATSSREGVRVQGVVRFGVSRPRDYGSSDEACYHIPYYLTPYTSPPRSSQNCMVI